jgi:hypothetical protein
MLSNLLPQHTMSSNQLLLNMSQLVLSQQVKLLRDNPELNIFLSNKQLLTMKSKNMLKEFQDKEPSLNMKKEDTLRPFQEKLPRSTIMPLNILNNIFLKLSLKLESKWFQFKEL